MKNVIGLVAVLTLIGCASVPGGGGRYDPNARETLGTVVARKATGSTTKQPRSSMTIAVGGIFLPVPADFDSGPLPIFEHRIDLDDGRTVVVYSWYADHPLGGCVKLFESPRSDYPRMINYAGCKARN